MAFGSPLHSRQGHCCSLVSLSAFCNETKTAIPTRDLALRIVQTPPSRPAKRELAFFCRIGKEEPPRA
ncbi:hypothetical protein JOE21_001310 [Desmospora profundinema]|uniref:Secreted protein n=1 Tax=Desmospora profundinema TaxID=1571184 RepID=A0ABU1IKK5_9BACL|nr:hypothetical protein [Desmospora profundinema]